MTPAACARRNSVHVGPARLGGGPRPGRPEQGADRRRADADPGLAQLALDPDAAPARVLPGESQDERAEFGVDRRPAGATGPAVRPLPPHELAVPTEQGRRGDEEGDPAVTPEHPTGCGEQDPVDGPELGSARCSPKHPELVAQDQDLEVLGAVVPVTPAGADDAGHEGTDDQVDERPHRSIVLG